MKAYKELETENDAVTGRIGVREQCDCHMVKKMFLKIQIIMHTDTHSKMKWPRLLMLLQVLLPVKSKRTHNGRLV